MFNKIFPIGMLLVFSLACRGEKKLEVGTLSEHAMVVTAHPEATRIGVDMLKRGGNAVDAAVAVQFALAVAYPQAGNIGGGGFMVARMKDKREVALDFREMAPTAASRDMYLDSLGEVVENLSWLGHLASGVPGSVAGMKAAHDSLGILAWKDLLQPAIELAEKGVVLTPREAEVYMSKWDLMKEYNTRPNAFTNKKNWKAGDRIFHPDLGRTLREIQERGKDGFYGGWVADSILAEMGRGGGILTQEDLNNYEAVWRSPIKGRYRGYDIMSMPPPSSGGIALIQLLDMIEDYPISTYPYHGIEMIHLMVEAERRVYADRSKYLGDSDFYDVPVKELIKEDYLQGRMTEFDPYRATISDSLEAGMPFAEPEQTTHFSIVDSFGNAVAVTTTINGSFGSCVLVGGAGFFLNNEMDDFSSKPGVPNYFGLLGSDANAIEPGKRMLSSMTPTILSKNDSLFMVLGTPGGSTIITSVFQNIVNVIDYGYPMQASVSASRFHHQWKPDVIKFEAGAFRPAVIEKLREIGHQLEKRSSIGQVDAILVLPNGKLEGGADPREADVAGGY